MFLLVYKYDGNSLVYSTSQNLQKFQELLLLLDDMNALLNVLAHDRAAADLHLRRPKQNPEKKGKKNMLIVTFGHSFRKGWKRKVTKVFGK